jgi:hypothetical protein
MSMVNAHLDDEELLAALRQALRAQNQVPPQFIEAAKSAFAWHNIDAELAQLTYDSTRDADRPMGVRSDSASIRALTFTAARLTIEMEVADDSLVGQIVPGEAAVLNVQPRIGNPQDVIADEIGRFSIYPIPTVPFRLQCRTASGTDTVTGWITL